MYKIVNSQKIEMAAEEIAAMESAQAAFEAAERTRPLTM